MPPRDPPVDPPRAGDLRERVWAALMRAHAAAYPLPVHGHNPNFRGAAEAAAPLLALLLGEGALRPGERVLCYPDYVLKPIRKGLLEAGIDVVVAAKYGSGYRLLESALVPPAGASSIAGAERHGRALAELPAVSMTFVACVALDERGGFLSKGYGFGLPAETRALPSATIVHPLQLLPRVEPAEGRVRYYALPGDARRVGGGAATAK